MPRNAAQVSREKVGDQTQVSTVTAGRETDRLGRGTASNAQFM